LFTSWSIHAGLLCFGCGICATEPVSFLSLTDKLQLLFLRQARCAVVRIRAVACEERLLFSFLFFVPTGSMSGFIQMPDGHPGALGSATAEKATTYTAAPVLDRLS
jgi:hypothetical protein